jgi:hypothetical protein
MPSLSSQYRDTKRAWDDDTSYESPGARFGLMLDPTAYTLDLFGLGGKYRDFIKKTGDESNRTLSSALGTDDRGGWAANKPASTIGMLIGGYYAGSGMMGGGGGGGSDGGLGFFGNGGKGGMTGVGQGNAGQLFANTGINTGGVQGVGGTGAGGGMAGMGMQDYAKMMPEQQQQPEAERPDEYKYTPPNPAYQQASVTQGAPITYTKPRMMGRIMRGY